MPCLLILSLFSPSLQTAQDLKQFDASSSAADEPSYKMVSVVLLRYGLLLDLAGTCTTELLEFPMHL